MNDSPNRSADPNWVETPDGEIVPSYTGPNVPVYTNPDAETRRQDLEEIHPEHAQPAHEDYATHFADTEEAEEPDIKALYAERFGIDEETRRIAAEGIAMARARLQESLAKSAAKHAEAAPATAGQTKPELRLLQGGKS